MISVSYSLRLLPTCEVWTEIDAFNEIDYIRTTTSSTVAAMGFGIISNIASEVNQRHEHELGTHMHL